MKAFLLACFLFSLNVLLAQVDLGYQLPPDEILKLVDAPLPPSMQINSEGTQAILLYRKPFKSIKELSQPEMRLAGLRINPAANIGSRQRFYYDVKVLDVQSKQEYQVKGLPENPQLSYFRWSPDEEKIAFTHTGKAGVELWVLDLEAQQARLLPATALNANMGTPMVWMKDSESLLVKIMPDDLLSLIDARSAIPTGPTISENAGKKAQNRTYQDLLKNKTDEHNFEQLARSTIVRIDLAGDVKDYRPTALYRSIEPSPDGNYWMITTIERPFSYLVPYYRFPFKTEIFDKQGQKLKTMLEVPLIEDLPKGFMAVRKGRRDLEWRSDQPATLYWVEALDEGDPAIEVDYRDAVYQQAAPFNAPARLLIETKNRFSGIDWGGANLAVAYDRWWDDRNTKTYLFNPSSAEETPKVISDRNYQDRYSDPGEFVKEKNDYATEVLAVHDGKLFLIGDGYSDEGILPFVDEMDVASAKTKRIFRAAKNDQLERIITSIDIAKGTLLTRLESKTEYPNYYIRNINKGNKLTPVTDFDNPFASIENVHKEVINYQRADGVDLSGTLYLPANYNKTSGEKLPMIMWAYPREYKDKSSAAQITSSPHEFTYPSYGSPIFWVTKGYAVLDRAAFPVIGEEDAQPNDSFREQLVANARAAIDAVDALGYIDRDRVAVGGHSYGAFMTANLLSHSNLFAAGIARSGAYNRTLTPFGFQREERTYWDAPEVYYTMSPFMHADKMKTPLLLIHGEADNNSGTYPMQSERYFNALKGLGATVRLVMLPRESHGYTARESILHILWEQDQWLEKYVKNRQAKKEIKP